MKRILIIAALLHTGSVIAQAPTADQRKKAAESVYAVYKSYSDNVNLRTVGRGVTDKKIVEFKGLFAEGATIDDDITPADTVNWKISGPVRRSVADYIAAVGSSYKSGINGSIVKANISYDSLSHKVVKIIYERNQNAINSRGYKFSTTDTMEMRIRLADDYSSAAIISVGQVGGQLKCQGCTSAAAVSEPVVAEKKEPEKPKRESVKETVQAEVKPKKEPKIEEEETAKEEKRKEKANKAKVRCPDDDDCDGVSNLVDKCPEVAGLAKYDGCPEPDPIRVGLSLNIGGGAGLLSVGSSPSSSYSSSDANTSYNNRNEVNPSSTSYKVKPGGGFHVGLDIDLFFGKKKNTGISVGVDLLQNFVTSEVRNFNVIYGVESDGNGNSYTRILTGNNYSEKITVTNLSIPILFKYQSAPTKPLGLNLEIGPVLSVLSSAATKASSDLDFEAAYGTNNSLNSTQTLQDGGTNPTASTSTWLITQKQVSANVKDHGLGVDDYFAKLYTTGRYVGLHQNHSGNAGTVKYNFGFGGLLRLGGVYRVNKSVSLLFGIYTLVCYNSHSAAGYQPVSASSDFKNNPITFQSFLNGLGSSITTQIGANIGLQVRFGKKETSNK